MNVENKPRFTQIMLGMADNFRDTITSEGMAMRFDMLSGYSIDQVDAGARKIIMHRKYTKMPPIAEFIEAIEGKPELKACNAWGVLIKGLESGKKPPDPKIIETIRRIGGWDWLCEQGYDSLRWVEKRFNEHFESLSVNDLPALQEGGRVSELAERVAGKLQMLEGGRA